MKNKALGEYEPSCNGSKKVSGFGSFLLLYSESSDDQNSLPISLPEPEIWKEIISLLKMRILKLKLTNLKKKNF